MSSSPAFAGRPALPQAASLGIVGAVGQLIRTGSEPVSPASLAAFRILFGLLGFIAVVRFVSNGWVSDVYIEPAHHFAYFGFEWVRPWPAWGMYLHFALLGLSSLGVALGYRYRLSITLFFVLFTYLELIDQTTYLNHYYLVSLLSLIMVFLPMSRAYSWDSRFHRNEGNRAGQVQRVPRAAIWALQGQLALVYVFAGIAKLNPDWLLDAQPLTIWLYNSTDAFLIGGFLREPWLPHAMSWVGALFDLTIVGWLLWRRTRLYAYAVLVLFHIATALLFPAIGMFPWIMVGTTLIFFGADWPERLIGRLCNRDPHPDTSPAIEYPEHTIAGLSWQTKVMLLLGVGFLAAQVVVPLRHLAYPGNVRWTEEGYHFSWRVLLTEKMGLVRFRLKDSSADGERLVYPEEYLTETQTERMAYQPSLILATAHMVRDDSQRRGYHEVEVRADVYVSYNGRPAALLIDPDADLANIRRGIGPKRWILPAPE